MIAYRLWVDAHGNAHRETASWRATVAGDRVQVGGGELGGAALVGLSDSPVDPAALAAASGAELYQLPLADGARLVDQAEWDATVAAAVEQRAEQRELVSDQLAARAAQRVAARDAALRKLAAVASLTDDELAALLGRV